MSQPFDALAETLLREGIAPRHVRRYIGELGDHLDALIEAQKRRGYDGEDAECRARALLGPDDELAAAMLAQKNLHALAARAPWLVFGVVPPLLIAGMLAGTGAMMVALWHTVLAGHVAGTGWTIALPKLWSTIALYAVAPLTAAFYVVIARLYRRSTRWLALAVTLSAVLGTLITFAVRFPNAGKTGEVAFGLMLSSAAMGEQLTRLALTAVVAAATFYAMRHRRVV